jgi:hypothetical protein
MPNKLLLTEEAKARWAPILDEESAAPFQDRYRRFTTNVLLENMYESGIVTNQALNEAAPANFAGGPLSANPGDGSRVSGYEPVLIALMRRYVPNMIAHDIVGVQPMSGPNGAIFAIHAKYGSQAGPEALYQEADTQFSGDTTGAAHNVTDPTLAAGFLSTFGKGMNIATSEQLGRGVNFNEMAFAISKKGVEAKTRALKAEYSVELAQDMRAIHGIDADTEIANMLSSEILAELNREIIHSLYFVAKAALRPAGVVGAVDPFRIEGSQDPDSPTYFGAGVNAAEGGGDDVGGNVYNLAAASQTDGRWFGEKVKSLVYFIQKVNNSIAKDTRRGRGNVLVVSSDVAAALHMADKLDPAPGLQTNELGDDTSSTFIGTLHGGQKVFVDPYTTVNSVLVGYKGPNPYDCGMFYCPYIGLQLYRAAVDTSFNPSLAFRTRYGIVESPYASSLPQSGSDTLVARSNKYYRIFKVAGL